MQLDKLRKYLDLFWDNSITPALKEYIKIPNKSPAFDKNWEKNGYMEEALALSIKWVETNKPKNSILHVKRSPGKTPLILLDIPGQRDGNILMYGHLDKQPEMEGWKDGYGPWSPILKDEKLYGRGGADDGYALFASLGIINALVEQGEELPRIIILIEFCEESGSPDLPYYINRYENLIGDIDLVICLDSGAGNYEQFWTTVSLRGMIACELKVNVLNEGVHSGAASGAVPSSFRIIRELISRLEDEKTGKIKLKALHGDIPDHRTEEVGKMVSALNNNVESFPWYNDISPMANNPIDSILNRTWRPTLSVIGVDGVPSIENGGNVLRPYTSLKLSFRLPPNVDSKNAMDQVSNALTKTPPYNATVSMNWEEPANGWNAPELNKWLKDAIEEASIKFYGKPAIAMGEGGTIPFMAMLGDKFPNAQFIVTGVLGPESNAHGPNEFLHIPFAKKLSACIALIIKKFPS